MILGIGLDLVELPRFTAVLERHGARFEDRVFTPGERRVGGGEGARTLSLAARFAAKEACMKALGTGWGQGVGFTQIEVLRGSNGEPTLRLHGAAEQAARRLGVKRTLVSLSHQPGVAGAMVVLEG